MTVTVAHPARYSDALIPVFRRMLADYRRILDPFAGTGRIHDLGPDWDTVGVELEPEWATLHPRTLVGDALHLPFPDHTFDAICTSPTYGNRMADHHNARDQSWRGTYQHLLGRPLHPDNTGQMQWGPAYRIAHDRMWREVVRVLRPGGLFVLNVKDHDRAYKRQRVTAWHLGNLTMIHGLVLDHTEDIACPGMGYGANLHNKHYPETVAVFHELGH